MTLSNDLISKFVKVSNEDKKKQKSETITYGVVESVTQEGTEIKATVVLHGTTDTEKVNDTEKLISIPATALVGVSEGDNVTVMIKNHNAFITGNITQPSAQIEYVTKVEKTIYQTFGDIADFDTLFVKKANFDDMVSENATIQSLLAFDLTVNGSLKAYDTDIKNLKTDKLDAEDADIRYATIARLESSEAAIEELETNKLDAESAIIIELQTETAKIGELDASVGDIETLLYGSASGDTLHVNFANAVISLLGSAWIKSAMIDTVSASKITSGDIITNNVSVKSEDGSLVIADETMQISDSNRVRVQIGKDQNGDYSINIWDANGNLMFSEGGITDSAIKSAIIRNDMVSDTANIHASKLDIDSLFEEINGSTKTISSSKILIDGENQTLTVAFDSLSSELDSLKNSSTSQGTSINAVQGQIQSKVWQQDINEATQTMSTQYSTLKEEVDEISATVTSHTTAIEDKADKTTVESINTKVTNVETDLSGFKTTVSNTYTTKTDFNNLNIGGRNLVSVSRIKTERNITTTEEFELRNDWASVFIDAENLAAMLEPSTQYTISYSLELIERTAVPTPFDMRAGFLIYREGVWIDIGTYGFKESAVVGDKVDFVKTFTTPSEWAGEQLIVYSRRWTTEGSSPIGFDAFTVRNFKIEKGNKATDWTPAPEDVEDTIVKSSDEIRQEMVEQNASIVASCNEIILSALDSYVKTSDYGEFRETVESQLTLLADQMTLNFTTATEQIAAVDSDLQNKFNTITKYFTFEVDGLTIGQVDSPYKTVIDNDRYTMYVNNTEVLWIDLETREVHTPELTITDRFRMLGLQAEKDSEGNVNWEFI